jgi:Kef-type K+ transport system membrane component KefB
MTDASTGSNMKGQPHNLSESENAMLTKALIVNVLVLLAVLEADLGPARKITRFRLLRPLLLAAAIVPMFLEALATQGTGLALEIGGVVAGALLGLTATTLMSVRRDARTGQTVTRAGTAYAALWIAVIAARSCFSIGAQHWFSQPLETWMANHQVTGAAITDTLIIMAICMTLARTLGLASRAHQLSRRVRLAQLAA